MAKIGNFGKKLSFMRIPSHKIGKKRFLWNIHTNYSTIRVDNRRIFNYIVILTTINISKESDYRRALGMNCARYY